MTRQTVGQYRVGSTFNPSRRRDVDRLKEKAAAFIDECRSLCEERVAGLRQAGGGGADLEAHILEVEDCYAFAERKIEDASMWAVKAATKRPREEP